MSWSQLIADALAFALDRADAEQDDDAEGADGDGDVA